MTSSGGDGLAIWGAGRAGGALAHAALAAGLEVPCLGNRSARDAGALALPLVVLTDRRAFLSAAAGKASLLFLAVPDDQLAAEARAFAALELDGLRVVHMSGARGLDALEALEGHVERGKFHPLASLRATAPIPAGCLCAIDGSSPALEQELATLAAMLGLSALSIAPGLEGRYHLGASLIANLPVALLDAGVDALVAAGATPEHARAGALALLRSVLSNVEDAPSVAAALTGPLARGDATTVGKHLAELAATGDDALDAGYRALSLYLLRKLAHDDDTRAALRALLSS